MSDTAFFICAALAVCGGLSWIAYVIGETRGYKRGNQAGYTLGRDTGWVDCQMQLWKGMDQRYNHARRMRNGAQIGGKA